MGMAFHLETYTKENAIGFHFNNILYSQIIV